MAEIILIVSALWLAYRLCVVITPRGASLVEQVDRDPETRARRVFES